LQVIWKTGIRRDKNDEGKIREIVGKKGRKRFSDWRDKNE